MIRKVQAADYFVSGSLQTGQLMLIRSGGSTAFCGVLMCYGTLVDNEDGSFDVVIPA